MTDQITIEYFQGVNSPIYDPFHHIVAHAKETSVSYPLISSKPDKPNWRFKILTTFLLYTLLLPLTSTFLHFSIVQLDLISHNSTSTLFFIKTAYLIIHRYQRKCCCRLPNSKRNVRTCLLYTSDAADE